ncbi:hypothetical protein BDV95DRAFT_503340 [Massariosphaeria phaeospora]|uniref:PH domain-containing protein n=1 Tax=Massariosphaeria phaeospora TaxID=100035 RepID=A0A7C8I085_9PLEO|nr:hypothetical protein BDV95DRAFT_503340 [Massariosphaeria phaeospora]
MDLPAELQSTPRSRPAARSHNSSSSSQSTPPTYGYHNTFHTHAPVLLDDPPTYACAISPKTLQHLNAKARAEADAVRRCKTPPPYDCTVQLAGLLGVKQELSSPFEVSASREWNEWYLELRGTQLSIYRIKTPHFLSKSRTPGPGRLIKTHSLQHAEVGIAADFKKTSLTPKSPFAHLVPASARPKLFETDPHLFEPIREHVIRLRLETEQILLCASTQEEMLHWVEQLCAGIDISPALEDRSEPRYRSLPRRTRRQRVLDGTRIGANLENLSSLEAGRRIIADQERIIRQLYPHLAGEGVQEAQEQTTTAQTGDPELEDFDPEDVRFPTRRPGSSSASRTTSRDGDSSAAERPSSSSVNSDPKSAPPHRHTPPQALRYRRRCAPVLLACSPRVSDVIYSHGQRLRINAKEHALIAYAANPPRYDAHNFPKMQQPPQASAPTETESPPSTTPSKSTPVAITIERPGSPLRGISDDSITSFGYDLASTSSEAASSGPPSPTAATQAKADVGRQLTVIGKRRNSAEARENALSAYGVGFLV